ncbi:unnamed protein product [Discula destructiva]
MAHSVTVQSAPVELNLDLDRDPEYDRYRLDSFDQSSAAALPSQHSDTLGASESLPYSASGLGSPTAAQPPSFSSHGYSYSFDQQFSPGQELAHDPESEQQHQPERPQLQEPLVSPSQPPLPPVHETHDQGHGQQPSQPCSPESVPVHARSPPPPPPPPPLLPSLHSTRSTRSHSVAASLASVGSQSSIRRKPLSPTASPLAVRFSAKLNASHSPLHDLQPPDSGYYSLDSPDLYDLSPNKSEHAPAPAPAPTFAPENTLFTPVEEESDEDA